jgi:L-iduronidase
MLQLFTVEQNGDSYRYDWTDLDRACDVLFRYGLHHQFEFDMKASGLQDPRDGCSTIEEAHRDRTIIRDMVRHLVDRYGRDEVATWWWETPNEGQFPWNAAGVGYWDACTRALADVDSGFATRYGGPGAIYRNKASDFIEILETTPNIFTGEQQHTVGFVSGHIKKPATEMITSTIDDINRLRQAYPQYGNIFYVNDEHDPWNGWKKDHEWAAGPQFAGWMCNAVYQGQLRIIEGLGQPYFSSTDNGFLSSSWYKRTQAVLLSNASGFALIKKPSHNAFTVLSLLGDYRLNHAGAPDVTSGIGIMATTNTRAGGQVAVMAFNEAQASTELTVTLNSIPFDEAKISHLRIDEQHSNPFRIAGGISGVPDEHQLQRIRTEMELAYFEEPPDADIRNGSTTITCLLPTNSVSLLLVSPPPDSPPRPVTSLLVEDLTGLHGPEKLITWRDTTNRCLRTYEILFADQEPGPYSRVNAPDILCTAFIHPNASSTGHYQVRAVDLWGRASDATPVSASGHDRTRPGSMRCSLRVMNRELRVEFRTPFTGALSACDYRGRRIAHTAVKGAASARLPLPGNAAMPLVYRIEGDDGIRTGVVPATD